MIDAEVLQSILKLFVCLFPVRANSSLEKVKFDIIKSHFLSDQPSENTQQFNLQTEDNNQQILWEAGTRRYMTFVLDKSLKWLTDYHNSFQQYIASGAYTSDGWHTQPQQQLQNILSCQVSINWVIIYSLKCQKKVKNHIPQPTDSSFTVINNRAKQQILHLRSWNQQVFDISAWKAINQLSK